MKEITENMGSLYHPVKALIVYKGKGTTSECYVEAYDMSANGTPINAHPLSIAESTALAKSLDISDELKRSFLKPKGLIADNVLYINPDQNGYAIWHTPAMETELYFVDELHIPNGKAIVPPLLWVASRNCLSVFALNIKGKPNINTALYNAPFFNLYESGKVCMGTVSIKINRDCMLEEFMGKWQHYFFNSYFSHLIDGHNPINGNLVQLWQGIMDGNKTFPLKRLLKTKLTIKNLL